MPKRINQTAQYYTDTIGVAPYGATVTSQNNAFSNLTSTVPALAADEGSKGNIHNSADKSTIHNTGVFHTDHNVEEVGQRIKRKNSDL